MVESGREKDSQGLWRVWLVRIIGKLLGEKLVQHFVLHKWLIAKVLNPWIIKIIVESVVFSHLNAQKSCLLHFMNCVLCKWSQTQFILHAPYPLHASISCYLCLSMKLMATHKVDASSLIPTICEGVKVY